MAKLALYQKYRSQTFEEVIGQEYIVRSIRNAVRENKVGHAYLFCGPRGTGKTTMARLLAKAVNCEHPEKAPCGECPNCIAATNGTHPDIVEINAANETSVDNIRELIDRSTLAPMQGKHKVYIIDEVHQLTSAASSALLKTLEEPPENVIFILATTDPQKLLPTIISRCQRYDFTKVKTSQIKDHLLDIAQKENIYMDPDAAEMIAVLADGGMRGSLSIMDQCASYTNDHITVKDINQIYGLATVEEKIALLKDIQNKDFASLITRIQSYEEKGIDLSRFTDGLIDLLKENVIYQNTKKAELLKTLTKEQAESMSDMSSDTCLHVAEKLMDAKTRFKTASNAASAFEVTCLAIAAEKPQQVIYTSASAAAAPTVQPKPVVSSPLPQPAKETAPTAPSVSASSVVKNSAPAEEPAEKHVEIQPVEPLTEEEILSILVLCNKTEKVKDENTWAMLKNYATLENRKYTTLLAGTQIAGSGPDCILVRAGTNAIVKRINEKNMNRELYNFLKNTMHTDKVLFAISDADFKSAVKAFMARNKEGTLPEGKHIEKYQEKVEIQETPQDKVLKLFGKENVEVV